MASFGSSRKARGRQDSQQRSSSLFRLYLLTRVRKDFFEGGRGQMGLLRALTQSKGKTRPLQGACLLLYGSSAAFRDEQIQGGRR